MNPNNIGVGDIYQGLAVVLMMMITVTGEVLKIDQEQGGSLIQKVQLLG